MQYYPITDFGPVMKGLVIGGLGIFHVFVAQFAIGAGALALWMEWLDHKGLATWVVHVGFVAYVMIGLALHALPTRGSRTIAGAVRPWLTFATGLAITAGVAPLLFAQVLYPHVTYSSHLLGPGRWVGTILGLIAGFYALYLVKSTWSLRWPVLRAGGFAASFTCFMFVAWTWSSTHQVSLAPSSWPALYESGAIHGLTAVVWGRLAVWFAACAVAFAALCPAHPAARDASSLRTLALMALLGLVTATSLLFAAQLPPSGGAWRQVLAVLSVALAVGWGVIAARPSVTSVTWRATCIALTTLWLGALALLRECVRADVHGAALERLGSAPRASGLGLFIAFLIVNGALIAYALSVVGRHAPAQTVPPSHVNVTP